jgi:hypothetical protein
MAGVTARTLRSWLADLPEFEERETWGQPTFRVRGRMFGIMDEETRAASLKATPEEQAALLEQDPRTFSWPAYVGRHGWVRVDLARVDPDQLHEIVVEAWRRTAPKRLVRAFDEEELTV